MAPNGNCTGVCWHANRRSPFCNRRCKVLVFHGCASSQAGKRAFGLLLLQASHQVKYRQQRLVCWSYFKIMTEALLWRRWNHLKRCTMNGYINCELLKTYTTSRSTCGWSNTHVSMHENTTSCDDACAEWEKPFHVERENGERKLWSGRQTIVRVRTVLESELPTTLTPELVLELRHTQRKPVSGRKPLRRLLSNPS